MQMWFDETRRADGNGSVPEKPPVVHPNQENSPLNGHIAKTAHALSNAGPAMDAPSLGGRREEGSQTKEGAHCLAEKQRE